MYWYSFIVLGIRVVVGRALVKQAVMLHVWRGASLSVILVEILCRRRFWPLVVSRGRPFYICGIPWPVAGIMQGATAWSTQHLRSISSAPALGRGVNPQQKCHYCLP